MRVKYRSCHLLTFTTHGFCFFLTYTHAHLLDFQMCGEIFSEGFIFAQSQVNSETESCIKLVTTPSSMHKGLNKHNQLFFLQLPQNIWHCV